MTINWGGYTFSVEAEEYEENTINISVKDPSMGHDFPVFYLKLVGLWSRKGEGFLVGDYYQASMTKESMFPVDRSKSYASITHEFLRHNRSIVTEIRNVYSSDINGHPLEAWGMSEFAKKFWRKQMAKNLPYIELRGTRYILRVNE